MRSLFSDKKGMANIPIRTSGRKRKGSIFLWALAVIGVVVLALFAKGLYNAKIAPFLDKKGITSSLEDGEGGTDTLGGSESNPTYTDRPNVASFKMQVLDNTNGNAVITAGVAVGAISKTTAADGVITSKEWLNPSSTDTNDTIATIPEETVLSFYGGDATYYLYPLTNREITVGDVVTLNGATVQAESSIATVVYDDTKATALSAATITAAADYKITLGSGQTKAVYIKVSNNGESARVDLKAICTGFGGVNISTFDVVDTDWTEVDIPKAVSNSQVSVNLSASVAAGIAVSDADYKACFVYKEGTNEVLRLDEWEDTPLIKATIEAKDDKNPSEDVVFFTAFDGAWARGSDGLGYFDFYQHDVNEADVGLAETETSPLGKQLGAVIEID